MDAYPAPYTEHNLPLVLISGLGESLDGDPTLLAAKRQENGVRIHVESPECRAEHLLPAFQSFDGSDQSWNALALPGPAGVIKYKIKTVGRTYTLPARKAAPLPQSPGAEGTPAGRTTELHSPLSPLSPGSPVFPDGIFTPSWFFKHQNQVPSIFLTVFGFDASGGPAQDETIKNDINAIRGALSRSGFRTRFAAILLSDESILRAPAMEERFSAIRKATNLDSKTGIFFMPPMGSLAETSTFVQGVLATLQSSCLEYYRDLTKHARRKKSRGGPAPQAITSLGGASHSTSTSGWNVRYEVKLGALAEFRQEMDVAERHYSVAIEELFSSEGGVFETTVNWSPRWDEARLLCDSLALRVLRCLLWNHSSNGVSTFWQSYRSRMRSLVDQRGKGSSTYGWDAWEARWAEVMAQLIEASGMPSVSTPSEESKDERASIVHTVYAVPDKVNPTTDTLVPFFLLHHSGYWLRLLAKGIRGRWSRVKDIPDEDRISPGQSPASAVVNRARNYDTYLVLEPHEESPMSGALGYDYATELEKATQCAARHFDARKQHRFTELMKLELARDFFEAAQYAKVIDILQDIWLSSQWRADEWLEPLAEVIMLLLRSVSHARLGDHAALVPELVWELASITETARDVAQQTELGSCLKSWNLDVPVSIHMDCANRLSPLAAAFAFNVNDGHVGEAVGCQLILTYVSAEWCGPIEISHIEMTFGSSQIVRLKHISASSSQARSETSLLTADVHDSEPNVSEASVDLRFRPKDCKVVLFSLPLRQAQIISMSQLKLNIETKDYQLSFKMAGESVKPSLCWYSQRDGNLESLVLPHLDPKSLTVRPKAPKMQIKIHDLRQQYCTGEMLRLPVELVNHEIDSVHASVVPKIIGQAGETLRAGWQHVDNTDLVQSIADLPSAGTFQTELLIKAPQHESSFTLSIDVRYTMSGDPESALVKTFLTEISFVQPFDIKFSFATLLHPAPWPTYFDPSAQGTQERPDGIKQLWRLGAQITSLVDASVQLQELRVIVDDIDGAASCEVVRYEKPESTLLAGDRKSSAAFDLVTQKFSLDDRRHTQLNLSLKVSWSREADTPAAETTVAIPRLTIPASEPRVLCTLAETPGPNCDLTLRYVLENPSAHFLTFAITMEANDAFAFSGPKYRTLSLSPLSRHHIDYNLLLQEHSDGDGIWLHPVLQVVDSYYQKNLKILPAGDRVKLNGKRELAVWSGSGGRK